MQLNMDRYRHDIKVHYIDRTRIRISSNYFVREDTDRTHDRPQQKANRYRTDCSCFMPKSALLICGNHPFLAVLFVALLVTVIAASKTIIASTIPFTIGQTVQRRRIQHLYAFHNHPLRQPRSYLIQKQKHSRESITPQRLYSSSGQFTSQLYLHAAGDDKLFLYKKCQQYTFVPTMLATSTFQRRFRNSSWKRKKHTSPSSNSYSTGLQMMFPDGMHHIVSEFMMMWNNVQFPFAELGKELSDSLDIGTTLSREVELVPATTTSVVLNSLGYDLLVFLAASVVVTPLAGFFGVTPILGYLVIGAILGPHGLDMFANSKADIELGDIGILFLLFSEGLEVSNSRLKKLTNFLPLGFAQISLVTGAITAMFLLGLPQLLDRILPLDSALIRIDTPVQAVVLAFAGALSTSAFIFPVLKERGWEEEETGEASTSILLLQDLLVAPVLVVLPFLVGESDTDYAAIGFLTAKAIFGFGAIMYAASFALRRIFTLVARTGSTETFVALSLLVAAGMGAIAKSFGLTDTAGAFAAGMLLANTNYRAQIQADVLPFKGILLGIFFMDAGSTFDSELVLREFPTIFVGAVGLMLTKIIALGAATRVPRWMEPNRLSTADAVRVTLLLSGGGEFAFVVLAVSERLKLISMDLGNILTAIVLITMGITPLLGQAAETVSRKFVEEGDGEIPTSLNGNATNGEERIVLSKDSIVVCGYGEIGRSLIRALDSEIDTYKRIRTHMQVDGLNIVAFDCDDSLVDADLKPTEHSIVLFGNGANAEVIKSSGITNPSAIFVAYEDHSRVLAATSRLRHSFHDTPIYARAAIRAEVKALRKAGATEIVVEADEMPRAAPALIRGVWGGNLVGADYPPDSEQLRQAAAAASGVPLSQVDELLELFAAMDQNNSGLVSIEEVERVLGRSTYWIANDEQIAQLDQWIVRTLKGSDPIDEIEFCRLYARSPDSIKVAFGLLRANSNKLRESNQK